MTSIAGDNMGTDSSFLSSWCQTLESDGCMVSREEEYKKYK